MRKRNDKEETHQNLLSLYRLLAIKYRYEYPLEGERLKVEPELCIILEGKICNAASL